MESKKLSADEFREIAEVRGNTRSRVGEEVSKRSGTDPRMGGGGAQREKGLWGVCVCGGGVLVAGGQGDAAHIILGDC